MPWIPLIQLAELTGSSVRTVKKRCEGLETRSGQNSAILMDSKQALPLIYQLSEDDRPDPTKEAALLSRERRLKTRVERLSLEGGLIPAQEVIGYCYEMAVSIRDKMLSIVPKLRSKYPHIDFDVLTDVDNDIRETLTELADDGVPGPVRTRVATYLSGLSTAAEADDQPMG